MSRLKKALRHYIIPSLRDYIIPSTILPPLDYRGKSILVPEAVISFKKRNLMKDTIKEYLVKWKYMSVEDGKWESEEILQYPELRLNKDKQFFQEE